MITIQMGDEAGWYRSIPACPAERLLVTRLNLKPDRSTIFNRLDDPRLTAIPSAVFTLVNLEHLNICYHSITHIPAEIGRLTKLVCLVMDFNRIEYVAPEIGLLTELIMLNLRSNVLTSLPVEIGQLRKMVSLMLAHNRFTEVPTGIAEMTKLMSLSLNGNQLATLPIWLGQLGELRNLYVANNSRPMKGNVMLELLRTYWKSDHDAHCAARAKLIETTSQCITKCVAYREQSL